MSVFRQGSCGHVSVRFAVEFLANYAVPIWFGF